ncbi:LamG-like jellyroll fold domain-containing protein [Rubritalea marina]|uniref:LamG-like jellyroll fold domain-containing protein n=1 Tax=Rubritalea marina TaxID=361055 RepID=UPI000375D6C9|nr:LamG-like jellyroll fold domain-containing protein [Rubritalea marina]
MDAANTDTIQLGAGEVVEQWADLSGRENHATTLAGALFLDESQASPSGLYGIDFGETLNSLELMDASASDSVFDFSDASRKGFAMFVVLRVDANIGGWNDVIGNSSSVSSGFGMRFSDAGTLAAYLGGSKIERSSDAQVTVGDTFVLAANYNAASEQFDFYDSLNDSSTSISVAPGDFSNASGLLLGATNNTGRFLDGVVYEVQLFERPLSTRQFAEEYGKLKQKWVAPAETEITPFLHLNAASSELGYAEGAVIAHWSDLSANGYDATNEGTMVTHEFGEHLAESGVAGVHFGAASSNLEVFNEVEQDALLDFTGSASAKSGFAVLVAFKTESFTPLWNDILGSESSFGDGFALRMSNTGQPVATLEGVDARSSSKVELGETVLFAFNYDAVAGSYSFWDSTSGETLVESVVAADFSDSSPFTIGRANNAGRYFHGSIYEVKVFDRNLSESELDQEKEVMSTALAGLELPVEVIGVEGRIEERELYLSPSQAAEANRLWLQVNNLGYENKAAVSINHGAWLNLNHDTVEMQYQEARRGGMAHGGFSTIRLSIPVDAGQLLAGSNSLRFRFNESDGLSVGYRVVDMNFLDDTGELILADSRFYEQDPDSWEAPYSDPSSIAAGKVLWEEAGLWSHPKADGQTGWWYDHQIPAAKPILANCKDCHTRDGRDLEIFSYSNQSIIERARFHQLSEEDGKLIASYIRSLSDEHSTVGRYGRPWNPPFQPGPAVAERPVEEWAAGAGLDAVLDRDADMRDYLFPNGEISEQSVDAFFDADKMLDHSLIPLSIQFPDWKHWLPMIHPKDAWSRNGYYDNPTAFNNSISADVKGSLTEFHGHVDDMLQNGVNFETLISEYKEFRSDLRFFVASGDLLDNDGTYEGGARHWRTLWGDANKQGLVIGDDSVYDAETHSVVRQFATTSLARLLAVKNFEFHHELNIQGRADEYIDSLDQPGDRQWISDAYNVFETPPHFNAPLNGDRHYDGQLLATGEFESTNWYHLQLVLNSGNGQMSHNSPVDYNYTPPFVLDASHSSGIYEPLRYFLTLNTAYQTKTWTGGEDPNDGKGFRIRVMGPWYIANISDSTQLNGFGSGYILSLLDQIEPGMSHWVMNAMLELFLTEMEQDHNDLSGWTRYDVGGDWSQNLDPIATTTTYQDPLDSNSSLVATGDWAHRIFYMVRFLSERGADPEKIDRLIDWGKAAWPNLADGAIGWDALRDQSATTLALDTGGNSLTATNAISVVIHNGGDTPEVQWYVNDVLVALPSSTSTLPSSYFDHGDTILVKVTSNSGDVPAGNRAVELSHTLPQLGFQLTRDGQVVEAGTGALAEMGDELLLQVSPISGPVLWLDAYHLNGTTLPSDGESISTWRDMSATENHALAPSVEYQPVFRSDALDGRPGVEFGAQDLDGLELLDANEDDFLDGDFTLFILGSGDVENGPWNLDLIGNDTSTGNDGEGWGLRLRNNSRLIPIVGGEDGNLPGYDYSQFTIRINKSGNDVAYYYNGQYVTTLTLTDGAKLTRDDNRSTFLGTISYTNPDASDYFKGLLHEVLIYDRSLEPSEESLVEGYLSHKWLGGDNLTSDSYYFENPPIELTLQSPDGQERVIDESLFAQHRIDLDSLIDFGAYQLDFGGASDIEYEIFLRQNFEAWAAENHPSIENRYVDNDGDGQSNFLEYALGSDPGNAESMGGIELVNMENATRLRLPVRNDDDSIKYTLQSSTNLEDWGGDTPILPHPKASATELIEVDFPHEVKKFYRIKVEPQ